MEGEPTGSAADYMDADARTSEELSRISPHGFSLERRSDPGGGESACSSPSRAAQIRWRCCFCCATAVRTCAPRTLSTAFAGKALPQTWNFAAICARVCACPFLRARKRSGRAAQGEGLERRRGVCATPFCAARGQRPARRGSPPPTTPDDQAETVLMHLLRGAGPEARRACACWRAICGGRFCMCANRN